MGSLTSEIIIDVNSILLRARSEDWTTADQTIYAKHATNSYRRVLMTVPRPELSKLRILYYFVLMNEPLHNAPFQPLIIMM